MTKLHYVVIAISVTCLAGCQTRYMCHKERSCLTAIQILQNSDDQDMICKIESCDDVDALRIIAFAARVAAWPMEAGPDVEFDNKMDMVALTSISRLYVIASDSANASIEIFKRAFPPDGTYSLFLKEWERSRESQQTKEISGTREQKTTTRSQHDCQP